MEYKHLYPLVKSSSFEGFVLKSRISVKCVCEATHCGFIFLSWKLEATWISSSSRWFCCFCSVANSCLTFCDPMDYSMPGFPVLHYLLEFAQTHVLWVNESSNHLILCRPLLLPPSIFPSIRFFSNESACHVRWPKYWSFNFNISPSNVYSGLISFRFD